MYHDHAYYRSGVSVGTVVYLIVGVILAMNHGYFTAISTLGGLLSAILAVLLWPLLLFGVDLHLNIGARLLRS